MLESIMGIHSTIKPTDGNYVTIRKRVIWDINHAKLLKEHGLFWEEDEKKFLDKYGFTLDQVGWDYINDYIERRLYV